MPKYDIAQRVLKDLPDFSEKQKKYAADKAANINWKPTFSRIKILPDPEQLSDIIDAAAGRESLTRGTIVALGPEVGMRDGKPVENFWIGQRVLYLTAHVMRYTGTDGVTHHFLKENSDVNSIIAIEPAPTATDDDKLDTVKAIAKSLDRMSRK